MSEPKRYAWKVNEENDFDLIEHSNGEFVRYSDYARLKAEVERLTERNQFLEQIDSYLQDGINIANEERCIQLEAQVERLTKAGDNMARVCHGIYGGLPLWEDWNKAKEGKQS